MNLYLIHACFIVLQLRSDSCQIHGYVMLCEETRWGKGNAPGPHGAGVNRISLDMSKGVF